MNGLEGKRIVITRASHQASELEQLLRDEGAVPLLYPCIAIKPPSDTKQINSVLKTALDGSFDWLILTSTNTVRALKESLDTTGYKSPYPFKLQVAAVGSVTARYAEKQLGLTVNVVPEQYTANALAQALSLEKNTRILLPQSEIAEPILVTTLTTIGAIVTSVIAYQTVIGSGGVDLSELLKRSEVNAITLTSASTVTNLLQRLQNEGGDIHLLESVCIACIGISTAAAAHENNLSVDVIPEQHTINGLVKALEHYYAELAIGESKS
jgi:uroporphyrinogen-III synthase